MPANAWLDTRCVAEALLGAVHRLPVASKRWAGRQVLQVFPSLLGLALCFFLQFQFQFVYSQPIRIEAEKGRTLN